MKYLNSEITKYIIFGVLTTLVNIGVYAFFNKYLDVDYKISTTIAWLLSVLFAYITNRKFVFQSQNNKFNKVLKEVFLFFTFRIGSYFLDIVTMIVLIEFLDFESLISKIIANILVVLFNFIASKSIIFK